MSSLRKTSAKPAGDAGGKRQRRRPTEVRSAITRSARHIFERHGYSGATTREIADHAGVNEVLLFRHFSNKANLFAETVYAPFAALLDDLIKESFGEIEMHDGLDDRRRFVGLMFKTLRDNRDLIMTVVNAQAYDPQIGDAPTLDEFFSQSLKRVMASEIGKAIAPDLLAKKMRCGFAAVVGTVLLEDWLLPGQFESEEEHVAVLTSFVDFGLYGEPEDSQ